MENTILSCNTCCVNLGDNNEKSIAAESIWVLAFSSQNRSIILADKEIMVALKDIESTKTKSRYVWRFNESKFIF